MASRTPLITGLDVRIDSARLEKLDWIASQLTDGNRSKAVRQLIDDTAELMAWQSHQREVEYLRCI